MHTYLIVDREALESLPGDIVYIGLRTLDYGAILESRLDFGFLLFIEVLCPLLHQMVPSEYAILVESIN